MRGYSFVAWIIGLWVFLIILVGVGLPVKSAEADSIEDRVERLEEKIRELEAAESNEDDLYDIKSQFGKNLRLFGDINYYTDSRERRNRTFSVGSLGMHSTASYGDRLSFAFEMIVVAHDHSTSVNLERIWVGYTVNDLLTVRAGRFHSALGYWNKTYHHGKYFFDTVERPFFLKFEDINGIMPIHIVGLEFSGALDSGAGTLKYCLQLGNGPTLHKDVHWWMYSNAQTYVLVPNNQTDDNDSKQVTARVAYEPSFLPGLGLGVFGTNFLIEYTDRSVPVEVIDLHQSIYGADLQYKRGALEILSEYFRFKNGEATANAYYGQLSYNLGKFTPYARYEELDTKANDPYLSLLSGGNERLQYIGGVRFDIDDLHSSVKAQYRYDDWKGGDIYEVFEIQWAFNF